MKNRKYDISDTPKNTETSVTQEKVGSLVTIITDTQGNEIKKTISPIYQITITPKHTKHRNK